MKLIYRIKPPCPKCAFTLGLVQFVKTPCPNCKANGYHMYERLLEGKGKQSLDEPRNKG